MPSADTAWLSVARTASSTWLVSDATAVASVADNVAPAGIVTSRNSMAFAGGVPHRLSVRCCRCFGRGRWRWGFAFRAGRGFRFCVATCFSRRGGPTSAICERGNFSFQAVRALRRRPVPP